MPPPLQIKIDQAGKPPGLPGQAREDLALGTAVQLAVVGGPFARYQWVIAFKPVDLVAGVRSSAALSSATTSTTLLQPVDKAGTYRVGVSVDAGFGLGARAQDVAFITFYAGPTLASDPRQFPRRPIAAGETIEHNVPDAIDPTGNPDGWARERERYDLVLLSAYTALAAGNAWTTTTATFTVPAVNATVNVEVLSSAWAPVNSVVYVASAGYYGVTATPDGTHVTIQNLGYPGNASPGVLIATAQLVAPSGLRGATGAAGAIGQDSFTTLAGSFTQPGVGSNVTATVANSDWAIPNQAVYVAGGGYYSVASIPNPSQVVLTNLGYPGNVAPGAAAGGAGNAVGPAGLIGPTGATGPAGTPATYTELQAGDLDLHEYGRLNPFNVQPSSLIFVNEPFANLSGFTTATESGLGGLGTPTVSGGVLTITHTGSDKNTGLLQGSIDMPQFCVSITIDSCTAVSGTYANTGVGVAKDQANFIMAVWRKLEFSGTLSIQVKLAGSSNWYASVGVSWTPPFELALSMVANSLTVWKRSVGGTWGKVASYDVTSLMNWKTASLTGWVGCLWYASSDSNAVSISTYKVGRFGAVGVRDTSVATHLDGTPVVTGNQITLTGTCTDPQAAAYCGVFTLDFSTKTLTQIGVIIVSRSAALQNDNAAHLISDGAGGWHFLITTWGNTGAANIQILYKHETVLTLGSAGSYIVAGMAQLSLPGIPGGGGAYDPSMVFVGGVWYLAATAGPSTPSSFYPMLHSSSDLTTWTLVGADTAAVPYEGTRIAYIGGAYVVLAAAIADAMVYDLAMVEQGHLRNLVVASGHPPHPSVFAAPGDGWVRQVTFNQTLYSGVANTDGNVMLMRAPRYRVP